MTPGEGLRVAIYSQDGFGLGHLRRTTLIGQGLLRNPGVQAVLLFADSPVAPWFALPEGMDCIKLPSIVKKDAGVWEPTLLRIGNDSLQCLRSSLLREGLAAFRPDILLVDHMPGGAQGELLPALEMLRAEFPACRLVLGLRDILDYPDVTMSMWWKDKAYYALRQYYHSIVIYGARDVFDTAATYLLPAPREGIHYCGYVVNDATPKPASEVRSRYGLPDKKLVVVVSGGGADGHHLMRAYISSIRHLGNDGTFFTLMSLGPHAPPDKQQELRDAARGLPIRMLSRLDDSLSAMAASDLVVCMAGYNTLAEILNLGKKALVVPRSGPSAEQSMRSRLFAQRGLIDTLHPRQLAPHHLASRLLADLERDDYPIKCRIPDMSGVHNAAVYLAGAEDELTHRHVAV